MKYNKNNYKKVVDEFTPKNKILKNCLMAFIFGGTICLIGEIINDSFVGWLGISDDEASPMTSVVLVGLSAVLTGLGWYDKLGKIGGAGMVVPITGFANSVVSPALEYKREGFILGTAANIFKLAGPVLLFGYFSSFIVGLLSMLFK
ncbi:MAG TPA: stage V sporulation protein AC [Sedimentibacter sp.]|nr:stage V sporulation protein AC [Sedimentibacter sp.]HNZ82953.1 stage V sporulation protein AC [Sedimentibacter sp.]HOH70111.1 stage V sporulation protein AC [Sedimentibacter sp.]HQB63080.1 stage V sporulation protein AC [Sedimentibacter sp.]